MDRLKFIRSLPGKAKTAALVRQALTPQDENAQTSTTVSSPPSTQRHRRGSLQPTPRQGANQSISDCLAPVTAADFQEQLYDSAGAIDLTRVKLKIKQHQQDLIAAGLQAPPDEPEPVAPVTSAPEAPSVKLRWQLAATRRAVPTTTDYALRCAVLAHATNCSSLPCIAARSTLLLKVAISETLLCCMKYFQHAFLVLSYLRMDWLFLTCDLLSLLGINAVAHAVSTSRKRLICTNGSMYRSCGRVMRPLAHRR